MIIYDFVMSEFVLLKNYTSCVCSHQLLSNLNLVYLAIWLILICYNKLSIAKKEVLKDIIWVLADQKLKRQTIYGNKSDTDGEGWLREIEESERVMKACEDAAWLGLKGLMRGAEGEVGVLDPEFGKMLGKKKEGVIRLFRGEYDRGEPTGFTGEDGCV